MSNMIVCPEPRAAKVGRDVFAEGGNAMDAAVAAAFVQAVVNPLLCGIGGSTLIQYYDGKKLEGLALNAEVTIGSRPAPEKWAEEFVGRSETMGRYIIQSEANQVGYQSIMIPGFVRGCWTAFQRFGSGRVSWAELLAPAARLASEGFQVYPYIAPFWQTLEGKPGYPGLLAKLDATPDAHRIYLQPDGSLYEEGDWLVQADLGQTLQRLADVGGDDFYSGEIAQAIIKDFSEHDALITAQDLQNFPVDEYRLLSGRYRDLELTAPPLSLGAQFIEMLQILENFALDELAHNSPEYIDTLARVQRATFADDVRLQGAGLDETKSLEKEMTSPERAQAWARRVKAGERIVIRGGVVDRGTTHLVCVDADQNVVSFNHSTGSVAGSGVITPGLGFLYNNFLGFFNPLPGHSDSIEPGKRMGGSMAAITFKDGHPYIAVGSPSSRSSTSVVQTLVNVVDHGMDMRTAVSVPRFHSEERQLIYLEPQLSESTAHALRTMGNEVERSTYMARVQAILVRTDTGELEAGPDPRGGAGVGRYP